MEASVLITLSSTLLTGLAGADAFDEDPGVGGGTAVHRLILLDARPRVPASDANHRTGHNLPQEAPQAFAQAIVDVDGY